MRLAGCNYGVLAPVFRDKEILQNLTCWSEWGSASVSLRQMTSPGSRVRYNAVAWCNPHSQIILHHLKFAFLLWNPSHNHNITPHASQSQLSPFDGITGGGTDTQTGQCSAVHLSKKRLSNRNEKFGHLHLIHHCTVWKQNNYNDENNSLVH